MNKIMQWYGIMAFFFMLFVLAGVVYLGANTSKLGFDFGEPSAISEGHIPPTVAPFELKMPSFTTGFSSQDKIDLDKFQRELQQAIYEAESPQEIDQVIEQYTTELFENNNFEDACVDAFKEFRELQNKMGTMSMTKFAIEYEDEWKQTAKEIAFCSYGFQSGVFNVDDPKWAEIKRMLEN